MSQRATHAMILLIGTLLGLPLGYLRAQKSVGGGSKIMSQWVALSQYESLALLQYEQSDLPHARQALLDVLKFLDETEASNRVGEQKSIDGDRGLTYMRLALLEQKTNNGDLSQDYIRKAQASFKKCDGKEYSDADLRKLMTKLDSSRSDSSEK
ncbi:MAG TPA: hypothetical protein VK763_08170 [Terriglobales bacterium]|jgi:hypothetical protein|nr:hypothetical protein [Terriglobales bacterium]